MGCSLFPAALIGLVVATGCFADPGSSTAGQPRLADPVVGWSIAVPVGWKTAGTVVATAFARDARCRSTFVDDRSDSGGPGPSVSRSFVQICARPIRDGRTLRSFLTATYGAAFGARFAADALAGRPAYRTRRSDPELAFLQTGSHRLQLASSASKDEPLRARRRAQVDAVLRSLRVRTAG
jgi:hypothetical protein